MRDSATRRSGSAELTVGASVEPRQNQRTQRDEAGKLHPNQPAG